MTPLDRSRQVVADFNAHRFDAIVAVLAPDFAFADDVQGRHSRADFAAYLHGWATGLPDAAITAATYHAAGDVVVIEFTGTGTHAGPLLGRSATHRPVRFPGVLLHHWGQDGLLHAARVVYDGLSVHRAISGA